MCKDDKCPLKDKCYRSIADPTSYRQSYFVGSPAQYDSESKFIKCDMFWGDRQNEIMDFLRSVTK